MNTKVIAAIVVIIVVVAAVGAYVVVSGDDDDEQKELLDVALEVYGNANNDWTIDDEDAEFVQSIIDGETTWDSDANPYADANNDGVITSEDVDQINALANNTAESVWILDGVGTLMEVSCQPERIYAFQIQNAELATVMGYGNNIVAAGPPIEYYEEYLFPDNPNEVEYFSGDYERLSELEIDLYLVFSPTQIETPTTNLPNTDVVYLGLYYPEIADMESSAYAQGILKAGYIFGNKETAEGFLEFLIDIRDTIYDITSEIDDEDKVNVLVSQLSNSYLESEDNNEIVAYLQADTISQAVALAGGNNVASSLDLYDDPDTYSSRNETEWLDTIEIDFVTVHFQRYAWTGVDESAPEGGYTATDATGMYEWITEIASRSLLGVDESGVIMLSQENRNGCTGGIMAAAYLFTVFYPDLAEENGFDADELMEEYLLTWLNLQDYDFSEHRDAIIAWGGRS